MEKVKWAIWLGTGFEQFEGGLPDSVPSIQTSDQENYPNLGKTLTLRVVIPGLKTFKRFSAFLNRPEIHPINHLGATGFIGSDLRQDPLKAAPARSIENCSSQRGSDSKNENDGIGSN